MTRRIIFGLSFLLVVAAPVEGAGLVVHGYGGRGCADYLDSNRAWDAGEERGALDFFGYQQWLAGMVTALSAATGRDVLHGADVEGMMRRIARRCEDDPGLDVFGAATGYLKQLDPLP
jgi:hypothetical protein